ncbi:hypothetical protein [Marinicellulosiphila megalodicopiae]|uniref:hypothetical protein n=1 Tax=Marinicellulosiphila megalodicopiae TaxID=2724896 RepID=UPI003BB067A6
MIFTKKRIIFTLFSIFGIFAQYANAEKENIYQLKVDTDSNWTSIEIRDDAVFVIPPDNQPFEVLAKKGAKSFTISEKRVYFEAYTRGETSFDLYVFSPNQVLGLTICKGSRTSYTTVITQEGKHKNDSNEQDLCEKAALVLVLH